MLAVVCRESKGVDPVNAEGGSGVCRGCVAKAGRARAGNLCPGGNDREQLPVVRYRPIKYSRVRLGDGQIRARISSGRVVRDDDLGKLNGVCANECARACAEAQVRDFDVACCAGVEVERAQVKPLAGAPATAVLVDVDNGAADEV